MTFYVFDELDGQLFMDLWKICVTIINFKQTVIEWYRLIVICKSLICNNHKQENTSIHMLKPMVVTL